MVKVCSEVIMINIRPLSTLRLHEGKFDDTDVVFPLTSERVFYADIVCSNLLRAGGSNKFFLITYQLGSKALRHLEVVVIW